MKSASRRKAPSTAASPDRVIVRNPNAPGYATAVDRTMYEAMKKALLAVLPRRAPGLTQTEMREAVLPHLPQQLFPGGAKADWWSKCVQLDLEARGEVVRDTASKPLRWSRAS